MKIDSLKELKALIQLCRKTGIEAIEVEGLKMNLGPTPTIISKNTQLGRGLLKGVREAVAESYAPGGITEDMQIPTDGLTDEQRLFYSSVGHSDQQ